jgi:hypothetical protein
MDSPDVIELLLERHLPDEFLHSLLFGFGGFSEKTKRELDRYAG